MIPRRDGAVWRAFQAAARHTGSQWSITWCPSHLVDKEPPPDAAQKYDKACVQPGWQDAFMHMNAEADALATEALGSAAALHTAITDRERALATA